MRTCEPDHDGVVAPAVRPAPRRAFSLVELLIVIGIIASLVGILIPTIARARESAIRVQCASNLRQVGLVEAIYANNNRGWLLMRDSPHSGTLSTLSQPPTATSPGSGLFSINLAKAGVSPMIWFCPRTNRTNGEPVSARVCEQFMLTHRTGYGFYGGYWDGAKALPANPAFGLIDRSVVFWALKITDLRPYMMRAGEFYFCNTSPGWHTNRRSHPQTRIAMPDGGNILMGDGSVHWSTNQMQYYGGEMYIIPEGRPNVP